MTPRGLVRAALAATLVLLPLAADAATPRCDRCSDLPLLENELFEQEFLLQEFQKLLNNVPYDNVEQIQAAMQQKLDQWKSSPAGGGRGSSGGTSHPSMGLDLNDCQLTEYVKTTTTLPGGKRKTEWKPRKGDPKQIEDRYRKAVCKEIADFVMAHENTHKAQCDAAGGNVDFNNMFTFAQMDVEAYAAGIQSLRDSISNLARQCGWQGSSRSTKKVGGKDMPVVPTPADIATIKTNVRAKSDALRAGRGR